MAPLHLSDSSSRATRSKKPRTSGWDTLSKGELLKAAEEAGFEVFLTTDKNIRYQQNLAKRVIAIVVLGNSRWPVVQRYVDRVVEAVLQSPVLPFAPILRPLDAFCSCAD
jgi:hypothetical protein